MDPNDLSTENWYDVVEGLHAATDLVITSDFSGPVGVMKEAHAGLEVLAARQWQTPFMAALGDRVLAPAKDQQEAFDEIARARSRAVHQQPESDEALRQRLLATIRSAAALVDAKAGEDAAAEYRQLVLEVANRTAAASKEGGFLGFGGELVSEAEHHAVASIRDALGP